MLRLHLLGPLDATAADGAALPAVLAQPKRLVLLAYLAVEPGAFRRRDALVALFWPEADTAQARLALRQALHHLRRALGPGVLVARGPEEVGVAAGALWCDVAAFEAACRAGAHVEALALYRGDFLDGVHAAGAAPELEEWVAATRARLRAAAVGAARADAACLADGDPRAAADRLARAEALEPFTEALVRERVRLLVRAGEPSAALRVAAEFTARLERDLGAAPGAELRAAVAEVRAALAAPGRSDASNGRAPAGGTAPAEAAPPEAPVLATAAMPAAPAEPARRDKSQSAAPRWVRHAAAALLLVEGATLAVAGWRAAAQSDDRPAAGTPGPLLVAVLPFDHVGPADRALFTDALTDAVSASLGAAPGLAVIDRRSAQRYRATAKSARQVGAELGAAYLVEGVVRWARSAADVPSASGAARGWRAQVTPTLVDARAGVTRWTGAPLVVTATDPLTAPARVAAAVAESLRVALRPGDRAALVRRLTETPEAYAAYVRGRALADAAAAAGTWPAASEERRVLAEFARAVALDSTFADAWGYLAMLSVRRAARALPGPDSARRAAEDEMRATLARADRHARLAPFVLMARGWMEYQFGGDAAYARGLVDRAVAAAPSDGAVLSAAARYLWQGQRYDTAYALLRRAAALDPRSAPVLSAAGGGAAALRRWPEAERYAGAVLALDSADARGWELQLRVAVLRGDTLAARRALDAARAHVARPGAGIVRYLPFAGAAAAREYAALSLREVAPPTFFDTVGLYYNNKAVAHAALGDTARERAADDSVGALLAAEPWRVTREPRLHAWLALVQARHRAGAAARRSAAQVRALARTAPAPERAEFAVLLAAAYARIGAVDTAVRLLEEQLGAPAGGWTAPGFAAHPRLRALHREPAFARLRRAYPTR